MKTMLALCLLLVGAVAQGQSFKSPLPLDSVTHKVTYSGVVEVPGASKGELYSRAREWFAVSFGSSKAVLEMDDKEAGKLIGNANSVYNQRVSGTSVPTLIWRTINVQVKDGRFKYSITNFATDLNRGQANAISVERYLVPASFDKAGNPKPYYASLFGGVKESAESQVKSLFTAMTKAISKEKDW